MSGFRHVVMFSWAAQATPEQREKALAALRAMAADLADLGTITVGTDAGLAEGNADFVVVGDFPSQENYLAYQQDEGHQRIVKELIRPAVSSRTALQHHR
ncbi:MAG: Dabb family protein [Sporichthyaceae bacterium]|jgi:endonuclease/exonuclease/phosphatase family metal-dependent hydrolase